MLLQRRLLRAEHGQRAGGVVLGPWWTAAKRWVLPGSIYRLRGSCWVKNPGVGNGVGSGDAPAHAHAVEDTAVENFGLLDNLYLMVRRENKKTEMKLRATNLFKRPPMILGGSSGDSRARTMHVF